MEIPIKISKTMSKGPIANCSYENRVIRIPAICREKHKLKLHDFITLKNHEGGLLTLQITEAYAEDVFTDRSVAFVTEETYNSLHLANTEFKEISRVKNITLGCDPELYLVDKTTSNIIGASRFFEKYGIVGHDGLLMEIRPMPSIGVKELTTNIYNLLLQARAIIDKSQNGSDIALVAASHYKNGITAGFHLHYGLPEQLLGTGFNLNRYTITTVTRLMVMVLDYYVGIPAIIAEGKEDTLRRTLPYVKYGKPGGYVLDNRTLEYRLPGGHMLRHPILSEGLIALGIVVVEDIVSRLKVCTDRFINLDEMKTLKDMYQLYPNLPDTNSLYHCICNKDDEPARKHLNTIINDVKQMVGYNERLQYIRPLFKVLTEKVKFDNNIEENWRDYINEEQSKQMVLFQTAF